MQTISGFQTLHQNAPKDACKTQGLLLLDFSAPWTTHEVSQLRPDPVDYT